MVSSTRDGFAQNWLFLKYVDTRLVVRHTVLLHYVTQLLPHVAMRFLKVVLGMGNFTDSGSTKPRATVLCDMHSQFKFVFEKCIAV